MNSEKYSIILVDDVMFHLLSLKERLKDKYTIYPAQSSEELFKLLHDFRPDLIILDINMPNNNGFETIEALKADPFKAEIPVVFLTSQKDRESLLKAIDLGAADYLVKPITDTELIECIEYQLNPESNTAIKPVILTVDDSPTILKSVNALLRDKHVVYSLPDSSKIKDLLAMVTPDLFILDCNMPGLSGFDLVPIIRGYTEYADTPIIFLTGDGTRDNLIIAAQLGASDFLVKPIDETLLREKVDQHLKDFIIRRRISRIAKLL